jgi:hypothetical protein
MDGHEARRRGNRKPEEISVNNAGQGSQEHSANECTFINSIHALELRIKKLATGNLIIEYDVLDLDWKLICTFYNVWFQHRN